MTKLPSPFPITVAVIFATLHFLNVQIQLAHALGSGSTLAVSYASATVCGVVAFQSTHNIQCYSRGLNVSVQIQPNVSFSTISGGASFFCGLRTGGYSLLCWNPSNSTFERQRIYYNDSIFLNNLSVGDNQVCATTTTGVVSCWRGGDGNGYTRPFGVTQFGSISSGFGFSCGILAGNDTIRCWGSNPIASRIESEFGTMSMLSVQAGGSHVCGVNSTGFLVCKGDNSSGQLDIPVEAQLEYRELALGANHTCAIRNVNGSVVCWGGNGDYSVNLTNGVSFEKIVSGSDFTCGLTTANLSVLCWGPGWPDVSELPLPSTLPGPCVRSSCDDCGPFPQSEQLCSGSGNICSVCPFNVSMQPVPPPFFPPPPTARPPSPPSEGLRKGLLAFAIVGSIGAFSGICTIIYCLYTGVCFGNKKVYNSVQPTITRAGSNGGANSNNSPISRSSTIRRQGSRAMRRQRSGTSSKHADRAEEFTLGELAAATNDFSLENKIGAGSFGIVYRGKLPDGREVAIKRGETGQKMKKFQEKETAFDSELAFLSRLHHKHLVRLVGYCEERDERLLVYDYMKNGALYDHLHAKDNVEKSSSVINSWRMRIKVALDAARGIEYLHNYAVPPIIHRDIKSSNILLDSNWIARVSDFGLSLMGPEPDRDYRPTKAAGTVGYIDPEYYGLNVLTAKSDVYGLGVVLLELLTGKRAIFKSGENGGPPISLVDFAVPAIMAGELVKILDDRVGPPELNEAEAVELVAYTAMHCVNLEGKDRPTMTDIVANLERALALCDHSHGSISSGTISIVSD
ncbi:putative serine/threonine-protein kinase-like protein CCR3 [Tripterygium wilfordii]|uniref:putative serine/threonine-protein kinase-like protein CCR3 n=1 Tax=Tripterygium wilfordii TaxID=458696 RepID=UPI0018F81B98|nr:putative serine/threonine-protein kinase-like protein CCR3 [Tripterygium wilfordii]